MASVASRILASTLPSHPTKRLQSPASPCLVVVQKMKNGGRCRAEEKVAAAAAAKSKEMKRREGSMVLAAAVAAMAAAGPAAALVDERMSTEGTGLPFGLSNNILGWLLLGGFGIVWALYFVYASSLDEDEDSGMSL